MILEIKELDNLIPGRFVNSFSPCSFSDLPPDINRFEITLSNKTKKSKDPDICKLIQKFLSNVKKKAHDLHTLKFIMKYSLKWKLKNRSANSII